MDELERLGLVGSYWAGVLLAPSPCCWGLTSRTGVLQPAPPVTLAPPPIQYPYSLAPNNTYLPHMLLTCRLRRL